MRLPSRWTRSVRGNDAVFFHWTDDGDVDSVGTRFVIETRKWFDSVWNSIAAEASQ